MKDFIFLLSFTKHIHLVHVYDLEKNYDARKGPLELICQATIDTHLPYAF